jgi:aminoglycoside phosphotransferase (APT) family kinase protein
MAELAESDVIAWAERALGSKVVDCTRQSRDNGGRPAWFITCRNGSEPTRYYIRGNRGPSFEYNSIYSLDREAQLLKTLKKHGIPVPGVVAESSNPYAVILEFVDGLDDFTLITDQRERDEYGRQFGEIMAKWHSIPVSEFEKIGFLVPKTGEEYLVQDLDVWEKGCFPHLKEPVPLVSFACQWMRRNPPEPPRRPVLAQGDTGPGQFIFKDGRIKAVVDWELAFIGDPMNELARIRTRDMWYPTGNLPRWFQYYSEYSGTPLDLDKIRYYSVIAMMTTALALGPVAQRLDPRDVHAEWIAEEIWSKRATIECLAEAIGVKLEAPAIPHPEPGRLSALFDVLEENLRDEQFPRIEDRFLRYRMSMDLRLLTHIRHLTEIGRQIEADDLDDMKAILGRRPNNRREGMVAMDEFVRRAGPEMDAELTRYFYRHAMREEAVMRGAMGRIENAVVSPIA